MSEGQVTKWELVRRIRNKNKVEPEAAVKSSKSTSWRSRGVSWLALHSLTPQEIRKQFAKETGRYLIFLVLFSINYAYLLVTLLPRDQRPTFLQTDKIRGDNTNPNYSDMLTPQDYWSWLINIFYPSVYNSVIYTGSLNVPNHILFYNQIVGAVRLRQLRVKERDCSKPSGIHVTGSCYPSYGSSNADKSDFHINGTVYKYQKADTDYQQWGELAWYPSGGYIVDLPGNDSVAAYNKLMHLYEGGWIDRQTRALFVEMVLYNPNVELHTSIILLTELSPTGGLIPSSQFRTQRLNQYANSGDYALLAFEFIFVLMIFYYVYEEIIEIIDNKLGYFKDLWNFLDWANLICFFAVIALRIQEVANVSSSNLNPSPYVFLNIEKITFNMSQEQNINAFNGLLCWIKILKYIHIFPKMKLLTTTLVHSAKSVIYFFVLFTIMFMGFAFSLYISVGKDVGDFATVPTAMFTLFEATLGQFNFDELRVSNRILGPLLFVVYMLLVFFILANVFIAIINVTYEYEAKIYQQDKENKSKYIVEDAIIGFFTSLVRSTITSWTQAIVNLYNGWKRDIATSDLNGDGTLDQEELRQLRDKVADNPEILQLIEEADKNKDQTLSASETKDLLNKIDEKMQQQVSKKIRESQQHQQQPHSEITIVAESQPRRIKEPKIEDTSSRAIKAINAARLKNLEQYVAQLDSELKENMAILNTKMDRIVDLLQRMSDESMDIGLAPN